VAEFTLTPAPPLAGIDRTIGNVHIAAPADLAIVALALPPGGEDAALAAIEAGYGHALPAPGKAARTGDGETLLRLTGDQAFVLFSQAAPDAAAVVAGRLAGAAHVTDQTDSWCALTVSGAGSRAALERICPVDLHPDAFAINDAARTVMEHLGVLILRTGADDYLLLSASSSAASFLHAVDISARNVA